MIGIRTVLGFGYDMPDRKLLKPQPKVWQGYNSRRGVKRKRGKGARR